MSDSSFPIDPTEKQPVKRVFRVRRPTFQERFEKYYAKGEVTACWLWTGAHDPKGYGCIWSGERQLVASRASWLIYRGAIPEGIQVCHTCDNPQCVNIHHLFLGTRSENAKDMVSKGRNFVSYIVKPPPTTKISMNIARQIRKDHAAGKTVGHLTQKHGLDRTSIYNVISCRTWREDGPWSK